MGINTAFPSVHISSDGTEFGRSKAFRYIGLKQYERWFKKLSENGCNVARVWLGYEYFNPDTEQAYEFDYKQYSKIDKLLELAKNILLSLN